MGEIAAKKGDYVMATDIHIVMLPAPPGPPAPTPVPHPFNGMINGNLSPTVKIMGRAAATVGSTVANQPIHIPQGGPFQKPPANQGKIIKGSATVRINNRPAARSGDTALTCNDPADLPGGVVQAAGTVFIGG
jgi:uncharacterized Zn-binding protein involved in type VI secretion